MVYEVKELLKLAEECINAGQIAEGTAHLTKLSINKLPRSEAIRTSKLLRRVSQFDLALRIMLPIVRPKKQLLEPATAQEKAECAICLHRCGSREEAAELLTDVSPAVAPEVLLYRTIFRFAEWDYRGGAVHARELLNVCAPENPTYRYAQMNLAAACVFEENFAEAEAILKDLRATTQARGETVMYCNSLEISAQVAIFTGQYDLAHAYLSEAEKTLKGTGTLDGLWILKWRAVLSAFTTKSISPLGIARDEALAKRHWETLRELDFISCRITFDESTFLKLYFGTAYASYRERLERHFGKPSAQEICIVTAGVYKPASPQALNLFTDLDGDLSPGDLPHILFLLLISDSYRSLRTGQIHSRLFPGDHFNPYSSPDRVHQIVKRLRNALEKQIPGVEIIHDDGVYKLDFTYFNGAIQIPKVFPELTMPQVKLHSLEERLHRNQFASADVQEAFSLSRSAAKNLISVWRETGAIEMVGNPRLPSYIIKKSA